MGQTVRRKQRPVRPENGEEENFERPDQDSTKGSSDSIPRPRPNRKPPKSPLPTPKRESNISHVSATSQNSSASVGTFYSRRPPPAIPKSLSRSMEDLSLKDEFAEYEEEPFTKGRPAVPSRVRHSADVEHMYVNTVSTRGNPADVAKPSNRSFNNELSSALNQRFKDGGSTTQSPPPPRRSAAPARPPPPRRN